MRGGKSGRRWIMRRARSGEAFQFCRAFYIRTIDLIPQISGCWLSSPSCSTQSWAADRPWLGRWRTPPLLVRLFGHWGFLKTLVVLEMDKDRRRSKKQLDRTISLSCRFKCVAVQDCFGSRSNRLRELKSVRVQCTPDSSLTLDIVVGNSLLSWIFRILWSKMDGWGQMSDCKFMFWTTAL